MLCPTSDRLNGPKKGGLRLWYCCWEPQQLRAGTRERGGGVCASMPHRQSYIAILQKEKEQREQHEQALGLGLDCRHVVTEYNSKKIVGWWAQTAGEKGSSLLSYSYLVGEEDPRLEWRAEQLFFPFDFPFQSLSPIERTSISGGQLPFSHWNVQQQFWIAKKKVVTNVHVCTSLCLLSPPRLPFTSTRFVAVDEPWCVKLLQDEIISNSPLLPLSSCSSSLLHVRPVRKRKGNWLWLQRFLIYSLPYVHVQGPRRTTRQELCSWKNNKTAEERYNLWTIQQQLRGKRQKRLKPPLFDFCTFVRGEQLTRNWLTWLHAEDQ